jgi:hypothetical protein
MIKLQPIIQNLSVSRNAAIYFLGFFVLFYSQNEFAYSQQVNRSFPRNNTPELPNIITLLRKSKIGGQGAETKGSCFTLPFIPSDSITESANPVIWVYIKPIPVPPDSQTKITISYRSLDRTDKDDKVVEDFITGADSRFKSYTIPSKVGRKFSIGKKYRIDIACGSETNASTFFIERKPSSGIPKTLHPFKLIAETAKLNLWSETINLLFSREIKSHPNSNTLFEKMVKDFPFRDDVTDGKKIDMVETFKKLKI